MNVWIPGEEIWFQLFSKQAVCHCDVVWEYNFKVNPGGGSLAVMVTLLSSTVTKLIILGTGVGGVTM